MRVLVTGGAGFVGGHLSKALLDRGDDVTIVDSFTDYYDVRLKRETACGLESAGACIVEGDLNSIELSSLLDVDVVFHQAGQPGVRKSWGSDFAAYVSSNIAATQRLLEAIKTSETSPRVVYASSSSVYGSAEAFPTTELMLPQPKSPYGVTKLAAEHLMSLYAENFGVRTCSLRYFTVYGPKQRPDMAFTRFITAALQGGEIQVYGDGEQVRDFTFVKDIVAANLAVADADLAPGSVFNVSGGSNCSVNDVLATLKSITGRELNTRHLPVVDGDVTRTGGDCARLRDAADWSPAVSIDQGLEAQVEWLDTLLAAREDERAKP
jgi:UDP-glucuronate 4-epimerase